MGSEIANLVVPVRDGLREEAGESRRLASCLRGLDFEEAHAPHGIRELEGALEEFSTRALGIVEALGHPETGAAGLPALLRELEQIRIARHSTWASIGEAIERLGIALEETQNERGIDRMRLIESLRMASAKAAEAALLAARAAELDLSIQALQAELHARDDRLGQVRTELQARDATLAELSLENESLDTVIAKQQTEIARLDAILSQDGHQLVTRLGSLLAPYPAIVWVVRLPIRLLRWLTRRSSR